MQKIAAQQQQQQRHLAAVFRRKCCKQTLHPHEKLSFFHAGVADFPTRRDGAKYDSSFCSWENSVLDFAGSSALDVGNCSTSIFPLVAELLSKQVFPPSFVLSSSYTEEAATHLGKVNIPGADQLTFSPSYLGGIVGALAGDILVF